MITIVSLTRQLSEATNDFGRTIESPANQMRILNEQWERLTRAIGNMFMPILAEVLPYLNAIFMVLTEIINTVAILFGYNTEDYDYFGGVADSVLELEDSLNGASNSVEKLKQGLRSFDKLNNITTPASGGSSISVSGSGGINPDIWNAFNDAYEDYNNKLDDVQMKATKIRDAIMDWLNFEKQIDPLTGDISFKFKGIDGLLENIWNWFKDLSPEAKALAGIIAILITKNTINLLTKFSKLLGSTGLFKIISSLLSPLKSLYGTFNNVNYSLISTSESLEIGMYEWSKNLTLMDRLKVTLVGAGGLYASYKLIESAMQDVNEQNELTTTGFLKLGGGIATAIASGALIGSQFGIYGTIIGGVAGALYSLYEAFMEYPTSSTPVIESLNETTEATRKYLEELEEQNALVEEQLTNNLVQTGIHERLVEELEKITDANGKVKDGYEDRANFILNELSQAYGIEYSFIDGIIKDYDTYIAKIKDLIKAKQAEYLLEANRQIYTNAISSEAQLYDQMTALGNEYNKALKDQAKAQDDYNKKYKAYLVATQNGIKIDAYHSLQLKKAKKNLDELNKSVTSAKEQYDIATEKYKENILVQNQYSDLQTSVLTGNLDEINEKVDYYTNSYIENGELVVKSDEETNERLVFNWGILLQQYKETSDGRYQTLLDELTNETNAVEEIMPEQAMKWGKLAESDKDAFLTEFSKLDKGIQQQVIDKMQEKGYEISSELQKGINKINPTIKIDADTNKAESKIQGLFGKFGLTGSIANAIKESFNVETRAKGGLPPVGQLFVANEKGAEFVGHIGGQSFVANQNQMMELLDRKLGQAQNTGTQIFNIYLDENNKLGTYTLDQLKNMAKSNGRPITIR